MSAVIASDVLGTLRLVADIADATPIITAVASATATVVPTDIRRLSTLLLSEHAVWPFSNHILTRFSEGPITAESHGGYHAQSSNIARRRKNGRFTGTDEDTPTTFFNSIAFSKICAEPSSQQLPP